VTQGLLFQLPT